MKVLNVFGDQFSEEASTLLRTLGEIEYRVVTQTEISNIIHDYDVVFLGLYPELSREVLEKANKLKVIVTATTNLDHIDLNYVAERGIAVLSLKEEIDFLNTITGTAEMAVGLMIDLMRFTPWAFQDVLQYHWRRDEFRGHNLYGQTLGIVGLGRLGTWMARYGNAFNMRVIAYSPTTEDEIFEKNQCGRIDFDTLLKESDVISIHAHLKDDTKHMFDAAAFSKMKKTAYLINTAIREVVHEGDLLKALEGSEIAGYGTDVLADELWFDEGFKDHPLVEYAKTHKNLIIVPHIGGMTYESRKATDVFMTKKLLSHVTQHGEA